MNPYFHHHQMFSDGGGSSFWGAFWGALFAFIFGLVTYIVTRRREGFVQHKNALVKMERFLNRTLDDVAALTALAEQMESNISVGRVISSRLFTLQIPDGIDMEVRSIEFINKLMSYQLRIDRFNLNVAAINHAITRAEDMVINGRATEPREISFIRDILNEFRLKEFPRLDKEILDLLVTTRIHLHKLKDKNSFIYGVIKTTWEQDIADNEIKDERTKLNDEIVKVRAKTESDVP